MKQRLARFLQLFLGSAKQDDGENGGFDEGKIKIRHLRALAIGSVVTGSTAAHDAWYSTEYGSESMDIESACFVADSPEEEAWKDRVGGAAINVPHNWLSCDIHVEVLSEQLVSKKDAQRLLNGTAANNAEQRPAEDRSRGF